MPPRVLTSSASTTNSEDSLNDPGQTRATGTQSERTASTPEGLGQAAGTYTTYTGGFRTVDRTEGISEVASGPVNPTCCLNPDATAVPPSLPCLFSGVSSTPRRSLFSGSAENQDGGQATNTGPGPTAGTQESTSDLRGDTPLDVDAKLAEVYGEPMVMMDETDRERATSDPWYLRWERAVRLSFRRYHLPNGNVGRKFVEMLADEIDHVAEKKSNSERLIVFQVLILQREMLVSKSSDIRRLIGRRLKMWEDGLFDALMHDAERCDRSFGNGRDSKRREQAFEHMERVFHRLMIEGKVRSAVRWITERERGGLLKATDITTITNSQGQKVEMTVLEVLQRKHPEPAQPGPSLRAFLPYPEPPPMIDLDVTGAHILSVARWLRGGAGPGGSNSSAWQDWLLRYGGHSERLRDAVARLTRVVANSPMPWEVLRAPLSSRLIALDNCPGVRPIGIGNAFAG